MLRNLRILLPQEFLTAGGKSLVDKRGGHPWRTVNLQPLELKSAVAEVNQFLPGRRGKLLQQRFIVRRYPVVVIACHQDHALTLQLIYPRQESAAEPFSLGIKVLIHLARENVSGNHNDSCRMYLRQIPVQVCCRRYSDFFSHMYSFVFLLSAPPAQQ